MDFTSIVELISTQGLAITGILVFGWIIIDKMKKADIVNDEYRKESKEREDKISAQLNIALQNNQQLATVITKDLPEMREDLQEIKEIIVKGDEKR